MTDENKLSSSTRDHWSSRFGFILAATGAAVGLGNVWKFPYMAGENGGSAFVLVYLICVILIGIPVMMSEVLIGRRAQRNAIDSMALMAEESGVSRRWAGAGWLALFTLLLILSFYSVVASWSLSYTVLAFFGQFNQLTDTQIYSAWTGFLAHPWKLLFWDTIFMVITMGVVARGVENGLERASRLLMPALFLILVVLDVYAYFSGDFSSAWNYLFSFNLHKLNAHVLISAMGHSFFTLAIGVGTMMTYGSYLSRKSSIPGALFIISGLDVLIAVLAGLAIFPIIFGHNLSPQGGPGLMFEVLPIAFSEMPAGQWVGGLFFLLLLFAAWTSSISMGEPLVSLLSEDYKLNRHQASWVVGFVAWVLSVTSILSFNVWSDFQIFGSWNIFGAITDLCTNILMPMGGLLFGIFAAWRMKKVATFEELDLPPWLYNTWRFTLRYISIPSIFVIFVAPLFQDLLPK